MDISSVLANIPAMPPPPGVKSNFDHPETDSQIFIIVSSIFTAIPVIAVIMRIFSRSVLSSQKLWWDDGKFIVNYKYAI
jgi:hypothetical protein